MVGKLELKRYDYKEVVLSASGVEFTGKVNIKDEKVYSTEGNINCKWNGKSFSFALNQDYRPMPIPSEEPTEWTEPTASINNWPTGLSIDETIEEFKAFVLNDIA